MGFSQAGRRRGLGQFSRESWSCSGNDCEIGASQDRGLSVDKELLVSVLRLQQGGQHGDSL